MNTKKATLTLLQLVMLAIVVLVATGCPFGGGGGEGAGEGSGEGEGEGEGEGAPAEGEGSGEGERVAILSKYTDLSVIPIHDPASADYDDDCIACHGDGLAELAAAGDGQAFHANMSFLGTDSARCLACHEDGMDLIFRTSERLREDLFAQASCATASCHGVSAPESLRFYAADQ